VFVKGVLLAELNYASGASGTLTCGKKTKRIGMFDDLEDAKAARRMAEAFSVFHPNHGQDRPL